MNRKQYTPTKRNGRKTIKHLCLILTVMLFIGGCAGRGDWTYELIKGYALDRCNAHSILLVHKDNPEDISAEIVIIRFYVTDFCHNDSCIGLIGIPTSGFSASDEELESGESVYYLVEVESGTIFGPYYDKSEYDQQCAQLECGDMGEWVSTAKLDYYLP